MGWLAIAFASVAFLSTMAGGFTALRWPGRVQALAALAGFFGGLFVYAASTILLPRAKELAPQMGLVLTLGGATAMFLITRLA